VVNATALGKSVESLDGAHGARPSRRERRWRARLCATCFHVVPKHRLGPTRRNSDVGVATNTISERTRNGEAQVHRAVGAQQRGEVIVTDIPEQLPEAAQHRRRLPRHSGVQAGEPYHSGHRLVVAGKL
jgi:hypothetical protein